MIDELTIDAFMPLIGAAFSLTAAPGSAMEAVLVEAAAAGPAPPPGQTQPWGGTRAPFSLVFRGPRQPVLPQRIYTLEHPGTGALEIFIVPIRADAEGVYYQAVFS